MWRFGQQFMPSNRAIATGWYRIDHGDHEEYQASRIHTHRRAEQRQRTHSVLGDDGRRSALGRHREKVQARGILRSSIRIRRLRKCRETVHGEIMVGSVGWRHVRVYIEWWSVRREGGGNRHRKLSDVGSRDQSENGSHYQCRTCVFAEQRLRVETCWTVHNLKRSAQLLAHIRERRTRATRWNCQSPSLRRCRGCVSIRLVVIIIICRPIVLSSVFNQ
mmetsp:Transcript_8999/g.13050  ORF Transcript_8999/g.13050 Transcript_8999/m.13050 type:complete len:219 (-) Transcript_8999:522-1178(-)